LGFFEREQDRGNIRGRLRDATWKETFLSGRWVDIQKTSLALNVALETFVWAPFRFLPFVRGGREG